MGVALDNDIERLGRNSGGERRLKVNTVHNESLSDGFDWLNSKMGRYRGRPIHKYDPCSWILEQTTGLFGLRLLGKEDRRDRSNARVLCV